MSDPFAEFGGEAGEFDVSPTEGRRIGGYELLGRLATGGMAELFLARRLGLEGFQKIVALKQILPQFADNADFVEMFLHEARLAARLDHPNIVQVFDIGRDGRDYFFVMAYLHGKDLLAVLREASRRDLRLPIQHAVTIASGLAAGLHYAHELRDGDGHLFELVHRDVSPANIIVTFDGDVKLVDFGIAKAAARTNVTQVGVRKGKAAYMAPEQCRAEPVDRRTDVWAMGVVLWELLTGRRLFKADHELAAMHRIVNEDAAPPSTHAADVPADLERIVMRCLRRVPEERYQTALEFSLDLAQFCQRQGVHPSSSALAEQMHALFGHPPLPWMRAESLQPRERSSDSAKPLRRSIERRLASGEDRWVEFDTELSTRQEPTEPPRQRGKRRRSVHWVAGGLLGALGVGFGLGSVLERPGSVVGLLPPPTVDAPSRRGELQSVLELLDTGALDFETRHRLIDALQREPAMAALLRPDVQVAIDLLQADTTATPCTVFAEALRQIELDPRPSQTDAIAEAAVPGSPRAGQPPDGPCTGLQVRLEALRDRLRIESPAPLARVPPPPVAQSDVEIAPPIRPATKKRRRPVVPDGPRPQVEAVPPAPVAEKLSDELLPFGGGN